MEMIQLCLPVRAKKIFVIIGQGKSERMKADRRFYADSLFIDKVREDFAKKHFMFSLCVRIIRRWSEVTG